MMLGRVALATCIAVAFGCAKHVPEPVPHPSTPHITWSIGEGYNDKDVCKSTEVSSCTLGPSREGGPQRFAVFHVFLHAAEQDTKYTGTMQIGFLAVSATTEHRRHPIDRIVPKGSDPVSFSTTGVVAPPGTYYVDIDLTAVPAAGAGRPLPLKTRVRVDVK